MFRFMLININSIYEQIISLEISLKSDGDDDDDEEQ